MNTFFRRGISEYRRQISLKDSFALQTERLGTILESFDWKKLSASTAAVREKDDWRFRSLLLAPLVEIAWADGRVSRRESDAILEVAARYGLADEPAASVELLEKLTSRPIPQTVGRMWQDFRIFFENLSESEREEVKFCLEVQARFVAEQSSDNLLAFLRGEQISKTEQEHLQIVAEQLEKAHAAAKSLEEERAARRAAETKTIEANAFAASTTVGVFQGASELKAQRDDYSKLVPLVPLVKTAWAEGRVTKREREMIFEAAEKMGIEPGSHSYQRLSDWFELHPTDEFYDESLERLRGELEKLPEEERTLRRLDLLSDCVNVAEASGGTRLYPAGGARICDDEFFAVKHIANKLNGAGAV
jgi:uncharacterized tellurite resistance protein B-like protein